MTKYLVSGGTKISGTVSLKGAKNAGFKALIATLLGDSPSEICDLGLISEVTFAKDVITSLGGKVESLEDPHCLQVSPMSLATFIIPPEIGHKSRSSTMYVGPLLKRFGQALLPVPGGDLTIAKRPLDRHIEGLTSLGASVKFRDDSYYVSAPQGLKGSRYRFSKNTHTGTETLLMCACFAQGRTLLENAAEEPEVGDLISLLVKMGAKITRLAPRTLEIIGVDHLSGVQHTVMPDRNEAVTFGCIALASGGDVTLPNAQPKFLQEFLLKVQEAGGQVSQTPSGLRISSQNPLRATEVTTGFYPGFMTDWQPLWSTLMTQAQGVSLVHETVMDSRFGFVPNLQKMGAEISYCQVAVENPDTTYNFNLTDSPASSPHAIKITGPTPLQEASLEIQDIRQGATLLLAGIIASGKTTIVDATDQIKRGYEDLVGRLVSLGAQIETEEV